MTRSVYLCVLFLALTLGLVSPAQAAPTPTPTTSKYPEAVQKVVNTDNPKTCDRVAWSVDEETKNSTDSDEESFRYIACSIPTGLSYLAICASVSGDALGSPFLTIGVGNIYVICHMTVYNMGKESQFVSPMDYSIVSATNTKYDYTPAPFVMTPEKMYYGGDLPADQNVEFLIAFEVPTSAQKPLRLYVDPSLYWGEGDASVEIIIEKLFTT